VGRQGAATGIEIEISHPTTSSLHAVLLAAARPGRVLVEDTGSTNGTFVNDNPLSVGQRWELRDGDRLRFGLFNTVVKVIESSPAATSYPGTPP
jgi:pSer/pThr/pTyr-binding forkhead associated (FHA) protein